MNRSKSQEELYQFLAKNLLKENWVKESFGDALLQRELTFPTGIKNDPYNIALPHVDAEHVKTNALVLSIMEEPILFHRMDKVDEVIEVKAVFLLLIESPDLHIQAIVDLTHIWSNKDLMNSLLEVRDKDQLLQLFNRTSM